MTQQGGRAHSVRQVQMPIDLSISRNLAENCGSHSPGGEKASPPPQKMGLPNFSGPVSERDWEHKWQEGNINAWKKENINVSRIKRPSFETWRGPKWIEWVSFAEIERIGLRIAEEIPVTQKEGKHCATRVNTASAGIGSRLQKARANIYLSRLLCCMMLLPIKKKEEKKKLLYIQRSLKVNSYTGNVQAQLGARWQR